MRHNWTEADELQLIDAVKALETYPAKGVQFWAAVSGRLAPGIIVSGDACRKRFYDITQRSTESTDAWKAVTEKIEVFEQEREDWMVETLSDLQRRMIKFDERICSIQNEVNSLRRLWS